MIFSTKPDLLKAVLEVTFYKTTTTTTTIIIIIIIFFKKCIIILIIIHQSINLFTIN